mmetsp:Transcript_12224/g.19648  ORF Transcript_12224/g.19648 Transcript_12224/m.19648 type:complete len:219 (+) Transcript_12224:189-845(+)
MALARMLTTTYVRLLNPIEVNFFVLSRKAMLLAPPPDTVDCITLLLITVCACPNVIMCRNLSALTPVVVVNNDQQRTKPSSNRLCCARLSSLPLEPLPPLLAAARRTRRPARPRAATRRAVTTRRVATSPRKRRRPRRRRRPPRRLPPPRPRRRRSMSSRCWTRRAPARSTTTLGRRSIPTVLRSTRPWPPSGRCSTLRAGPCGSARTTTTRRTQSCS